MAPWRHLPGLLDIKTGFLKKGPGFFYAAKMSDLAVPARRLAVGLCVASLTLRYAGFRHFIKQKQISSPAYKPLQSLTISPQENNRKKTSRHETFL